MLLLSQVWLGVYCVIGFIGSWVWVLSVGWVWDWEETVIAGVVSYKHNLAIYS